WLAVGPHNSTQARVWQSPQLGSTRLGLPFAARASERANPALQRQIDRRSAAFAFNLARGAGATTGARRGKKRAQKVANSARPNGPNGRETRELRKDKKANPSPRAGGGGGGRPK
ncbi:Hypothetical predicted protein, partial [Olea europaea subsp. europaea]